MKHTGFTRLLWRVEQDVFWENIVDIGNGIRTSIKININFVKL